MNANFLSDTTGSIATGPQNTAAATGENPFLSCSSNTTTRPSWKFNNLDIVTSNCEVDAAYRADYATEFTAPSTCNLIVLNASETKGGQYSCSEGGDEKVAVLTVLGNEKLTRLSLKQLKALKNKTFNGHF